MVNGGVMHSGTAIFAGKNNMFMSLTWPKCPLWLVWILIFAAQIWIYNAHAISCFKSPVRRTHSLAPRPTTYATSRFNQRRAHRSLKALYILRFEGNPWDPSHDDSMMIQWNLMMILWEFSNKMMELVVMGFMVILWWCSWDVTILIGFDKNSDIMMLGRDLFFDSSAFLLRLYDKTVFLNGIWATHMGIWMENALCGKLRLVYWGDT